MKEFFVQRHRAELHDPLELATGLRAAVEDGTGLSRLHAELPLAHRSGSLQRQQDHLGVREARDGRGDAVAVEDGAHHTLPHVAGVGLVQRGRHVHGCRSRIERQRDRHRHREGRAVRREGEGRSRGREIRGSRGRACRRGLDADRGVGCERTPRYHERRAVRTGQGTAGRTDHRGGCGAGRRASAVAASSAAGDKHPHQTGKAHTERYGAGSHERSSVVEAMASTALRSCCCCRSRGSAREPPKRQPNTVPKVQDPRQRIGPAKPSRYSNCTLISSTPMVMPCTLSPNRSSSGRKVCSG